MRIITCFLIDCEFDTNYLTKHQHKIYFWILARRPSVGRNLMNYAKNSKSIGVQKPHNHSCKNWNLAKEFSLHLRSIFLIFSKLSDVRRLRRFVDAYLFYKNLITSCIYSSIHGNTLWCHKQHPLSTIIWTISRKSAKIVLLCSKYNYLICQCRFVMKKGRKVNPSTKLGNSSTLLKENNKKDALRAQFHSPIL